MKILTLIDEPFVEALDLALDRLSIQAPVGTPRLTAEQFCGKVMQRALMPFYEELTKARSEAIYGKLTKATDEQLAAIGLSKAELGIKDVAEVTK